jgi:hypothetical protein
MSTSDRLRRWAGWVCLGLVSLFCFLGYYFRNVRFTPVAAGFLILAAVGLIERAEEQGQGDAIYPGTDQGLG